MLSINCNKLKIDIKMKSFKNTIKKIFALLLQVIKHLVGKYYKSNKLSAKTTKLNAFQMKTKFKSNQTHN